MTLPAHLPRTLLLAILSVLLLASGCQSPRSSRELKRFRFVDLHMGSMFRIVLYAPDEATANHAAEAAFRRVKELDDRLTDYDPRSELRRLCQQPAGQPVKISRDLFEVLEHSQRLARQTDGAFDVTLGPLIQLWRQSRKSGKLPTAADIQTARQSVGFAKLQLNASRQTATLTVPNMQLDVGGIAKGYAADQALLVLRHLGIRQAMVAASGDIALGDPPPGKNGWNIAIESLDTEATGSADTVWLHNAGISTSGDTEQYVEIDGRRFSHIVNPATGLGLTDRIGVTIIAPTATASDSLATAVSVLGSRRGSAYVASQPHIASRIVYLTPNGPQRIFSPRFPRPVQASQRQ
jgi:thiamine biosynthesis lipoprotein